jgi:hypothetical protein
LDIELRALEASSIHDAIAEALRLLDLATIMLREDLKAAAQAEVPK